MDPISGRIVVTGAAGGLGGEIARALSPYARPLVLTARRIEQLDPIAADLGAQTIAADLEDRDQVSELADRIADADALVLNAALPASGDLLEYDTRQIDRAIEVNLRAPAVLARLAAEGMVARGRGHIVFISSLAGKTASPGTALYSATKFGLRGLSLAMRQDLHGTGVSTSVVCPGFVSDAGMFADSGARLPTGMKTVTPQQVADATLEAILKDRPEVDVAPLTLKLAAAVAQLSPSLAERGVRATGGKRLSQHMAESQKGKR